MKDHLTYIEPLEDRIAPATIINPFTLSYVVGDGDSVVFHFSTPLFASKASAANILHFVDNNEQLDLRGVRRQWHGGKPEPDQPRGQYGRAGREHQRQGDPANRVGNGQVNVGDIAAGSFSGTQFAGGIDLGSITIQGNLGQIIAGDSISTAAISSLDVLSMTSAADSTVLGPINKMVVNGDFTANLTLAGFQFGSINSLTIDGKLSGDSAGDSGTGVITFQGHIGTAVIGGIFGNGANTGELIGSSQGTGISGQVAPFINSLHVLSVSTSDGFVSMGGGSGDDSGRVFTQGQIKKLTLDGSLVGGAGTSSGQISAVMGTVNIGGNIEGGSGVSSGSVFGQRSNSFPGSITTFAPITSIAVSGNVVGGSADSTGVIAGQLGTVVIHGNLQGGSGTASGGIFSKSTSATGATISAPVGMVAIAGNVVGGTAGSAADSTTGAAVVPGDSGVIDAISAKSIYVAGSLIGGTAQATTSSDGTLDQTADTSGDILVNTVTSLRVGTDLTGGSGPNSGSILPENLSSPINYSSIDIHGSLTGGSGTISGSIFLASPTGAAVTSNVGTLHVGGSLNGGSGFRSAEVAVFNDLQSMTVDGSISGGLGSNSAAVVIGGSLNKMVVKGSLLGNQGIDSATAVVNNAYIQALQIVSLDIQGDVKSGLNAGGAIANSGAIRATRDISSITIEGNVMGSAAVPVIISAQQGATALDIAIGSLTIGTSNMKTSTVDYLDVLAGYSANVNNGASPLGTPVDGSAQIGGALSGTASGIKIFGTMAASNIVAGAEPDANGQFGTASNIAIPAKVVSGLVSKIASLTVSGAVSGDGNANDSFGIVAQSFGTVSLDGTTYTPASAGVPKAINGNLFLLEVP